MIALALCLLAQETVIFRTAEGPRVYLGPGEAAGVGDTREMAGKKVAFVAAPGVAADLVVWVTDLDREKALVRLKELKGVHLAVCSGRGTADAEPLKVGDAWLVPAPGAPGAWGRVEVGFRDGKPADVRSRFEPSAARPSAAVAKLAASKGADVPLKPALEGLTRALRFTIAGTSERPSYAGWKAPGGGALVLDVELENLIPLALVKENQVPVQYKIPNLADHLYLVVDGRRVSRLTPEAHDWPGHLPVRGLTLDRLGARLRGNVVFDAGPATSLELRYYDFMHGHLRIPLKGVAPEAKASLPPIRNEAVEMAVHGARREPGRLKVDLRGRSLIEIDSDATAFDPKAAPGTRFKMGTVADWKDARKHLQLVIDGELAVATEDYPDAPRYLPDVFTGAEATFAVPEKAASLELRCDFPNAGFPDGKVIRPKALTFLLEGAVPAPKDVAPFAKIDDGIFQVEFVGQTLVKNLLTLDVVVRNTGDALEMFQTPEQLKYTTEKGQAVSLHPSTFTGPRSPLKLLGVPPGGRRSFQAVFQIPETDRRPRLTYSGVTKAEVVALKPLGPPAPAGCPSCKAEIAPTDKFCAGCGAKLR
ncbi:MAG TPA: zinc ribbon domain-containing protein [Planctomycetota bacterium]